MMTLIYLALAAAALIYLGMPLLIKSSLKINATPGMTPATPANLPDDVQEYFAAAAPKLTTLGFEQVASFILQQSTPNTTPHVSLWIHRKRGVAAAVNVIIASAGDKPPDVKRHVEFLTRIEDGEDGRSILTNNSIDLGAFKKIKQSDSLSAPVLQDITHLFRLHAWREGTRAASADVRLLPAAGQETKWFADLYELSIKRQLGTGYLAQDRSDPSIFFPTWPGAYFMTWGELPPMKGMRRSTEDKLAAEQIKQAASAPPPSPSATFKVATEGPVSPAPKDPPMRKVA